MTRRVKKPLVFLIVSLVLVLGLVKPAAAYTMMQPSVLMNYRQSLGGAEYFPLKKVADYHGFSIVWDGLKQKAVLYKDGRYLSFIVGEPYYLLDDQVGVFKYPVRLDRGAILIPKELAFRVWWQREAPTQKFQQILPFQRGNFTISKIVIDAGHGGKDQGARAYGLREKDINLQIAKRIRDKLRANGVDVLMTRETDRFVELPNRARIANTSDAALFVSMHANANPSRSPYGFEVYYLSDAVDDSARAVQIMENSAVQYDENVIFPNKNTKDPTVWDLVLTENRKESSELARLINKNIKNSRLTSARGVKTAQFHVLKWTDKPSILIETGFISNYQEARKLASSGYQESLANQITSAILEYKELYEWTNGFTK